MTPTVFARERLSHALLSEALPLLAAHWAEVAHYPDIPLNVDVDAYLTADECGIARCFTVRTSQMHRQRLHNGGQQITEAGVLVGYAVYFVRANAHYKQSIQAVQDVIYLHPSVRGGTGYKFIAWCDEQLRDEGVQAVYQHVKEAHNFGKLLERQGYELVDLIYAKRLDTPPTWETVKALANVTTDDLDNDPSLHAYGES